MNEFNEKDTLAELIKDLSGGVVDPKAEQNTQALAFKDDDEIIDFGDDFDFDGYQVVRREFFAHIREPSVTFNDCKFNVNSACLSKFPNSNYAQVLINRQKKILALIPCEEGAPDSFMWCTVKKGKRMPKPITCKLFFAKVVSLMDWNPDFKYKLLGKLIHANGEYLLAFDLTATEVYQKTFLEGGRSKTSRKPVFPAEWQDQFGLPFNEHRQSMQVNIFDNYAVFAVKENANPNNKTETSEVGSV